MYYYVSSNWRSLKIMFRTSFCLLRNFSISMLQGIFITSKIWNYWKKNTGCERREISNSFCCMLLGRSLSGNVAGFQNKYFWKCKIWYENFKPGSHIMLKFQICIFWTDWEITRRAGPARAWSGRAGSLHKMILGIKIRPFPFIKFLPKTYI